MQALHLPKHNATIRWQELGHGEPLICLPGISLAAGVNFLPVLNQPELTSWRAIMVDYLGSGYSDHAPGFDHSLAGHAGCVAAIMDHLDLSGAAVLGHSMGGSVAIALADLRPDLVAHSIVAEGNVTPGGGGRSAGIAAQGEADFVATGHQAVLDEMHTAAQKGREIAGVLGKCWQQADPTGFWRNAKALVDLPDGFAETYFAQGSHRDFLYGANSHPNTTGAPANDAPDPAWLDAHGIGAATVPEAGHLMLLENPSDSAAIIAGLLAKRGGESA